MKGKTDAEFSFTRARPRSKEDLLFFQIDRTLENLNEGKDTFANHVLGLIYLIPELHTEEFLQVLEKIETNAREQLIKTNPKNIAERNDILLKTQLEKFAAVMKLLVNAGMRVIPKVSIPFKLGDEDGSEDAKSLS